MRVQTACAALLAATLVAPVAYSQSESDREDRDQDRPIASGGIDFQPSFTVGFDFNTGDFGSTSVDEELNILDTTTISTPVSARVDVGDFRFSVSGSWVRIEGPGGVLPGGVVTGAPSEVLPGGVVTAPVDADDDGGIVVDIDGDGIPEAVTLTELDAESGFGDLTLGVNYNIPTELTGKFIVQLQGRLKIPTASSARGLGTGEVDGGGAIDIAYDLGDFSPFVTTGFRFRGDIDGGAANGGVDLNDTFNVSAGASYNLGGGYAVLGSYDFRQRTVDTADNSQEIFGAITGAFNDNVRWTLYGSVGLTDGAPDGGAGFQLTIRP